MSDVAPPSPGTLPPAQHQTDRDLLSRLVVRYSFFSVSCFDVDVDEDGTDSEIHFSGTSRADGKRVSLTRGTAREVAIAALGTEKQRRCPKCRKTKPPESFSRNADVPSGRVYRCKTCESSRVGEYQKKRRELDRNVRAMAEGIRAAER